MTRAEFIKKYGENVVNATIGTPLFPSVMMAQMILEGRLGDSVLAKVHHNHFGIKADSSWKGAKVFMPTKEVIKGTVVTVNEPFRSYPNDTAGLADRNSFLVKNTRYTTAGVFAAQTPEQQANALQKAGYATDPEYAKKLIAIINGSDLKKLDKKKEQTLI